MRYDADANRRFQTNPTITLGLSPKLVTKALETIHHINAEFKTTIVIVEQKVREVLSIANRVYALRKGEIAFESTASQLQDGDDLRRIFLV